MNYILIKYTNILHTLNQDYTVLTVNK